MEISIKGNPKEIAALVLELQERQNNEKISFNPVEFSQTVSKAIRDML